MQDEPVNTDYLLSDDDAMYLSAVNALPAIGRIEYLKKYAERYGADSLAFLFAQYMGLANSVVDNAKLFCIDFLITECQMHPHEAEKLNTATIFGALCGVKLANAVDENKTCAGCAYRLGTPANQSAITVLDADYCQTDGPQPFMCHEDMDERGEPKHQCRGFAQTMKAMKIEKSSN